MKFEVGDKFIIEIDRTYASEKHKVSRYGIKGFSTLIFDEHGLKRLKKYEQPMVSFNKEEDFKAALHEAYQGGYDRGVKDGAELAAMHGSDATSKELEKAYWEGVDLGAERAWEVARKCFAGFDYKVMKDIFGEECLEDNESFFEANTVHDAMKKIRDYETKGVTRIEIGDVVLCGEPQEKMIVNRILNDCLWAFNGKGMYRGTLDSVKKTNDHFYVDMFLLDCEGEEE